MKVCWFSAGVSSFIACYLEKDVDEIIYTHIPDQHPDSLRFLKDCEALLGKEIKILQNNRFDGVDDVISSTRYINGPGGARCTTEFKRNVRRKWERENGTGHTYIWGYDCTEKNRAARLKNNMISFKHKFPLIERDLTKQDCHDLCARLGIKRPAMYDLGYGNNNCIGCVKGGMGYWNKTRVDFPEVFAKRAALEREIGRSCINGTFLDELNHHQGDMRTEIFEECGMACHIVWNTIQEEGLE